MGASPIIKNPVNNSTIPLMKKTDTSPDARRVQIDIYRLMTPARKFELIAEAYEFGKSLAMAGIRLRYPDATEEQVREIWARQHLGDELYEQAYGSKENEQRRASNDDRKARRPTSTAGNL